MFLLSPTAPTLRKLVFDVVSSALLDSMGRGAAIKKFAKKDGCMPCVYMYCDRMDVMRPPQQDLHVIRQIVAQLPGVASMLHSALTHAATKPPDNGTASIPFEEWHSLRAGLMKQMIGSAAGDTLLSPQHVLVKITTGAARTRTASRCCRTAAVGAVHLSSLSLSLGTSSSVRLCADPRARCWHRRRRASKSGSRSSCGSSWRSRCAPRVINTAIVSPA